MGLVHAGPGVKPNKHRRKPAHNDPVNCLDKAHPLSGLQIWDRGWLSSTQTLVMPVPGEPGALLFDSAHGLHADQTMALLRQGLAGAPLRAVVNTHLHSDHCGGNAAIQAAFGAEVWVPEGQAEAAEQWDESRLSHAATGQYLPRFNVQRRLAAGETLCAGGRDWQLLAAPGHDHDALMAWDGRVLIAGDALWGRGFGVVFDEWLRGEGGFDAALAVLDRIELLRPEVVVPGHGGPVFDPQSAITQARRKLEGWRRDPASHARYAAKVLVKYHLMERRAQALTELLDWLASVPLFLQMEKPQALRDWGLGVIDELVARGALRRNGEVISDL